MARCSNAQGDLLLAVWTGPGTGLDWSHFERASARSGAHHLQQPRKVSHTMEEYDRQADRCWACRVVRQIVDSVVTPRDAKGCGILMSERHRHAFRFSENHRRVVDIAAIDCDAFGIEKLDLWIASDAAWRATIRDTNCHRTRTGSFQSIAGQDHQLIAGARRRK